MQKRNNQNITMIKEIEKKTHTSLDHPPQQNNKITQNRQINITKNNTKQHRGVHNHKHQEKHRTFVLARQKEIGIHRKVKNMQGIQSLSNVIQCSSGAFNGIFPLVIL